MAISREMSTMEESISQGRSRSIGKTRRGIHPLFAIDNANSWEELYDSEQIQTLDVKLAAALTKIMPVDLSIQVLVLEEKAAKTI